MTAVKVIIAILGLFVSMAGMICISHALEKNRISLSLLGWGLIYVGMLITTNII